MYLAICDDNQASISRTETLLREYFQEKKQEARIDTFTDTASLYEHLEKERVDLLFLDIVLSGEESGIETAKRVNELAPNCQIAFLTNYLSYATEIFDTEHCYFILKNELDQRIEGVLEKAEKRARDYHGRKLCISSKEGKYLLNLEDILYIEHVGRDSSVVCRDGVVYKGKYTLDEMEEKLGGAPFVRCHKGFIVNWERVTMWKRNVLYMEDGTEISVSRSYREKVNGSFCQWRR